MLKAWCRRHWPQHHDDFDTDFGGFLAFAIANSECDKKAERHFRHAGGGYIFEGDWVKFNRDLENWAREQTVGRYLNLSNPYKFVWDLQTHIFVVIVWHVVEK